MPAHFSNWPEIAKEAMAVVRPGMQDDALRRLRRSSAIPLSRAQAERFASIEVSASRYYLVRGGVITGPSATSEMVSEIAAGSFAFGLLDPTTKRLWTVSSLLAREAGIRHNVAIVVSTDMEVTSSHAQCMWLQDAGPR
jgi:hypothetical protein